MKNLFITIFQKYIKKISNGNDIKEIHDLEEWTDIEILKDHYYISVYPYKGLYRLHKSSNNVMKLKEWMISSWFGKSVKKCSREEFLLVVTGKEIVNGYELDLKGDIKYSIVFEIR